MGLFSAKKERKSFVLIDIHSSSVGGALAQSQAGEKPTLYFTIRHQIEKADHEDESQAMLRTLSALTSELVTKGAPILRKETGSGHIDKILVSVGAPWQKTAVRTETIQQPKPFTFTKALLNEITQKASALPDGYSKSNESVIAILLNGYEITKPFGKKVSRAELVILSSLLDTTIAKAIESTLRNTYHTHALTMAAFAPAAYGVFRDIYPHEKDFLIIDISGEATDIALVKHGVLVHVTSVPLGVGGLVQNSQIPSLIDPARNARFEIRLQEPEKEWLQKIQSTLQEFSASHALPRTVFMISDTNSREYLKRLLDTSDMRSLWLTTDPLRVIPVVSSHFATFIKIVGTEAEGDVPLELLGLYSNKTDSF